MLILSIKFLTCPHAGVVILNTWFIFLVLVYIPSHYINDIPKLLWGTELKKLDFSLFFIYFLPALEHSSHLYCIFHCGSTTAWIQHSTSLCILFMLSSMTFFFHSLLLLILSGSPWCNQFGPGSCVPFKPSWHFFIYYNHHCLGGIFVIIILMSDIF